MTQVWDISVLVDDVGRILEVRGQAELHLGHDGRGMIGKPVTDYLTPGDVEHFQQFFRRLNPNSIAPRCMPPATAWIQYGSCGSTSER